MYPLINLEGKRILITGASQGIGKETAVLLSKLGARCILLARNEQNLRNTLEQLEGEGHSYYCQDLSRTEDIDACVKNIINDNGKLDGMVYCAGVTNYRPLAMIKPDIMDYVQKVNLYGFIELVRCLTKKNRYNTGMRIVGLSSAAAIKGAKVHVAYSASKAGMDGAVRCMISELVPKGVVVNTIAPGMVRTELYENWARDNGEDSEAYRKITERQYLGIGEARDIANAIAFLVSPASKFVSGICLPVDGGFASN